MLQKIIKHTGWVCQRCRTEHNSRLNKLHGALTQTHEEMADMRVFLAFSIQEIDTLKTIAAVSTLSNETTQIDLLAPRTRVSLLTVTGNVRLVAIKHIKLIIHLI